MALFLGQKNESPASLKARVLGRASKNFLSSVPSDTPNLLAYNH